MIRITGSGQHIGSGPISFSYLYLERTRGALGQLFRPKAITLDTRKLQISGDLASLAGTAYTKATIEFRFFGDCIVYTVEGRIKPGRRTWAGFSLALGLLIAEAWLWPRYAEIVMAFTIARWIGFAATAWYLGTFLYFAVATRRQVLGAIKCVCNALERHD